MTLFAKHLQDEPSEYTTEYSVMLSRATRWENEKQYTVNEELAQEVPVALIYNGISHAVMMATPQDLCDFAMGFSLTEGIIHHSSELYDCSLKEHELGIEVDMRIASARMAELKHRRRMLAGRTGCGICGAESLEQTMRKLEPVMDSSDVVSHEAIQTAVSSLEQHQPLQQITGAMHAAAWCDMTGRIIAVREDVGRHNALDKLIGALHYAKINFQQGFVMVSSRASYEMVEKVASAGITTLVAISAPTSLAVRQAQKYGVVLVGFARPKRHTHYSTLSQE